MPSLAPGCYFATIGGYRVAVTPADELPRSADIWLLATSGKAIGARFVQWETLDELRPRVHAWIERTRAKRPDFPPPEFADGAGA